MGYFIGSLMKRRYKEDVPILRRIFWGKKRWILTSDFTYAYLDQNGSKQYITAPQGMITDGGTIPRCFWWYVKPSSRKLFPAYVIHDVMRKNPIKFDRKEADRLFFDMLIELGLDTNKAVIMFLAVSK